MLYPKRNIRHQSDNAQGVQPMSTRMNPTVERPNILLLHTDQQRFDTIAALGAGHVTTPNIDRLVRSGTSFTRAYSSSPVCQPARHDLITGVSARHHGYYTNRRVPIADYGLPTIPRLLTEAGYQTMAVGKMHFWPQRAHHGFAHMDLMEELPRCREDDAYLMYLQEHGFGDVRCQHGVRPLFYHTPQPSQIPEEHHGSAWVATRTMELMRRERHRPFFLFASWVGPHPPYYVPQRYLDAYRDAEVPTPAPATEASHRQAPPSPENPPPGSVRMRRTQEAYYAAITFIDAQIGRVLDELDRLGIEENTLVLFTTDHGELLGDLGCYQKHVPYEGSARIPLIASGPGFARGCAANTAVTTWDTAATILAAAGLSAPEEHPMVGSDLAGFASSDVDRVVCLHHGDGGNRYLAATNGRHKFVHWYNGGDEELYDLHADPWEQHNIIDEESGIAAPLRDACITFETNHGQSHRISASRFIDDPYREPERHACSLYPLWSSTQFPPWPEVYGEKDLQLIAREIESCAASEVAYICREEEWREDAIAKWTALGGDRAVYQRVFESIDGRTQEAADG